MEIRKRSFWPVAKQPAQLTANLRLAHTSTIVLHTLSRPPRRRCMHVIRRRLTPERPIIYCREPERPTRRISLLHSRFLLEHIITFLHYCTAANRSTTIEYNVVMWLFIFCPYTCIILLYYYCHRKFLKSELQNVIIMMVLRFWFKRTK